VTSHLTKPPLSRKKRTSNSSAKISASDLKADLARPRFRRLYVCIVDAILYKPRLACGDAFWCANKSAGPISAVATPPISRPFQHQEDCYLAVPRPHHQWNVNVRFGSKADMGLLPIDVRFTPKADIGTQSRNVRFVPKADSCTAAIVTAVIAGNCEFSPAVGVG
jgi:hypothetical protein